MTNKHTAIEIIKRLRANGHQALLAGGCVRDMLLGRPAKDYDVATSAHPQEVVKLFRRTLEIGAQFGVVMVMVDSEQVEVATFRTESGYVDGRHPTNVSFSDPQHDASRRDFTVNGMFFDPIEEKVYDYVDGQADLKSKIIRTIGNPNERFGEDYLRMLRGIRFSTQLDFTIAEDTWNAICQNASKITDISSERIAMEIEAIVTNPARVKGFSMLVESDLLAAIFPEYTIEKAGYAIKVLDHLPEYVDLPLALAAVFADFTPDTAARQLDILKLSNSHQKHISYLLENTGLLLNDDMSLADLKQTLACAYYQDLYDLQFAIQRAAGKPIEPLLKILARADQLRDVDLSPKPLLNGHQLIELGVTPGPMVGLVGKEMYIAQLDERLYDVDSARQWVQNWLQNHRRLN